MRIFLCFISSICLFCGLLCGRVLADAARGFAGRWDTTYGQLTLKVDGDSAVGIYQKEGLPAYELQGKIAGNTLTFSYVEASVTGEGKLILGEGGEAFTGQSRDRENEAWQPWNGKRLPKEDERFSGVWNTTYGMMRLHQKGNQVTGCYESNGLSELTGTIRGGVLEFSYEEKSGQKGRGEFRLAADEASFVGTWIATDRQHGDWKATRVVPEKGKKWLVVLEAHWEENLREKEYSFGDMLENFFRRVPHVEVRHRYFDEQEDFAKWCADLPYIAEPIVLYLSSHGTEKGITVGKHTLSGEFIGQQLRHAHGIKHLHMGACSAMEENVPAKIRETSGIKAPISGYTKVADWAGSAVIDFMLLDLTLDRDMSPVAAVKQILKDVRFSSENEVADSVIKPAGLKVYE